MVIPAEFGSPGAWSPRRAASGQRRAFVAALMLHVAAVALTVWLGRREPSSIGPESAVLEIGLIEPASTMSEAIPADSIVAAVLDAPADPPAPDLMAAHTVEPAETAEAPLEVARSAAAPVEQPRVSSDALSIEAATEPPRESTSSTEAPTAEPPPRDPKMPPEPWRPPAAPKPSAPLARSVSSPAGAAVSADSPAARSSRADPAYAARLLAWLERHKSYPRAARLQGIQGRAVVRLTISSEGRLTALSLDAGSGHLLLDEAALDMVRRSDPFPAPPPAVGAASYVVPVVFALADR